MLQKIKSRGYEQFSNSELLGIVDKEFHKKIAETLTTLSLNLETAHQLEPYEEELEYAWTNVKAMEELFSEHIQKEEQLLFPVFSNGKKRIRFNGEKRDLGNFIDKLIADHSLLKNQITQIRMVTEQYKCETSATPSHKLAFSLLSELEHDLNKMVFVEEEFLFPRAMKN